MGTKVYMKICGKPPPVEIDMEISNKCDSGCRTHVERKRLFNKKNFKNMCKIFNKHYENINKGLKITVMKIRVKCPTFLVPGD